jgi:hypothetical protein
LTTGAIVLLMRRLCCLGLVLWTFHCARDFPQCRFCEHVLLLGLLGTSIECSGSRMLTVHGGGSTGTSIYNPTTNAVSQGPALPLPANPGSVSLQIPNFGPRACQSLISQGNNTNNGYYYSPATNQFTPFTFSAGILQLGAHVIRYRSGTGTRFLIIHGATTATTIYKPDTDTLVTGPVLPFGPGGGSHSFLVASGTLAGKYMIAGGGGGGNWLVFDPDTESIAAHAAAPVGANNHSTTQLISSGARAGHYLIQAGGNNPNIMVYNPASDSFATKGNVSISHALGANSFVIASGANAGQIMLLAGSGTTIADRYIPSTDVLAGSGINTGTALLNGGHNFEVQTGPEAGNHVIVAANGQVLLLFRGASFSFVNQGAALQLSGAAGAGSNSVRIAD